MRTNVHYKWCLQHGRWIFYSIELCMQILAYVLIKLIANQISRTPFCKHLVNVLILFTQHAHARVLRPWCASVQWITNWTEKRCKIGFYLHVADCKQLSFRSSTIPFTTEIKWSNNFPNIETIELFSIICLLLWFLNIIYLTHGRNIPNTMKERVCRKKSAALLNAHRVFYYWYAIFPRFMSVCSHSIELLYTLIILSTWAKIL